MEHLHQTVADLRINYGKKSLNEHDVAPNPIAQFGIWLEEAINAQIEEANAMLLSTINQDNCPESRIVLLKGLESDGFCFYTNYTSRKGMQLEYSPYAALNFFWKELERQVRINGVVEKLSEEESDIYFNSRPKGSRIGAWVSPQSEVIPNREFLDSRLAELEKQYADTENVPRPPHWGGYKLIPNRVEFWQGRSNRLHDRILYTQQGDAWKIERLAP